MSFFVNKVQIELHKYFLLLMLLKKNFLYMFMKFFDIFQIFQGILCLVLFTAMNSINHPTSLPVMRWYELSRVRRLTFIVGNE